MSTAIGGHGRAGGGEQARGKGERQALVIQDNWIHQQQGGRISRSGCQLSAGARVPHILQAIPLRMKRTIHKPSSLPSSRNSTWKVCDCPPQQYRPQRNEPAILSLAGSFGLCMRSQGYWNRPLRSRFVNLLPMFVCDEDALLSSCYELH